MTKRPSAITLIDHGRTIASADKFGDVYSLPLLPTAEEDAAAKEVFLQNAKSLRVMATETTVHSKANMKSLEFQRKQAKENKPAKIKDTMEFAHSFLLGHISMITDIVATELPTEKYGSKHRTHILTSDRDEHIRISRGPPQSFVTEGYCLGHKEYISKMCLITANLLISGGGDDDLLVWDIIKRSATSKISIRSAVIQANEKIEDDFRIAVSGLWLYPAHGENEVCNPTVNVGIDVSDQCKGQIASCRRGTTISFPLSSLTIGVRSYAGLCSIAWKPARCNNW
jgi:tRNA (guanine-N(7)-)-methyltransferase subunit TRM82